MFTDIQAACSDVLTHPLTDYFHEVACSADMLRLDLLDPIISGNKAFKLYGHWRAFESSSHRRVLSFGGAHSNHLHALAAYAHRAGVPCTGMIRGYASAPLTDTLKDCQRWGMALQFLNKQTYAQRHSDAYRQSLSTQFDAYVIPEGGDGEASEDGLALLAPLCQGYDQVWLAVGSGATALGLAKAFERQADMTVAPTLVGVNTVADSGAQRRRWMDNMPKNQRWRLIEAGAGRRFASFNHDDRQQLARWDEAAKKGALPWLEPVYTLPLMQAFIRESANERCDPDRRVLLLHTGGLQGRRGFGLSWNGVLAQG